MSGWRSTRGGRAVPLIEALFDGLAPDGGLYLPASPPRLDARSVLRGSGPFAETALRVARAVVGDEVDDSVLEAVVAEAFDFPLPMVVPLVALGADLHVIELFHGPTLTFKDVGARFMASLMDRLDPEPGEARVVLVATSGDTGGAVASAFAGRERFRVVVLFPRDGVGEPQRRFFSTLGGNVMAAEVRGTFDDCQRLVKAAFRDAAADRLRLTAANSINIGRLLPQTFYYAHALRQGGWEGGCAFAVPSGNLGNLTAGLLVARAGLPVRALVAALNRNDAFHRYLRSGAHEPSPSLRTISNAMDVGDPSNLERLRHLAGEDPGSLRELVWSASFDDDATLACMARVYEECGYLLDPHSAVAVLGAGGWREASGERGPIIALASAHPAKFPDAVRRATGVRVEAPAHLAATLAHEERVVPLPAELPALLALLERVAAAREVEA